MVSPAAKILSLGGRLGPFIIGFPNSFYSLHFPNPVMNPKSPSHLPHPSDNSFAFYVGFLILNERHRLSSCQQEFQITGDDDYKLQ